MHDLTIQVNSANFESSAALNSHAEEVVRSSLKHVAERVTRVEVHLHDDNGGKKGVDDKHVTMEGRIAGEQPITVDATAGDFYPAIKAAADKLHRALSHRLDKKATH